MSKQIWTETIVWLESSGSAVVNTTTETILIPANTALIPANYMGDGRSLHIFAMGSYSTTSTPTMLFTLRAGGSSGTLLCKSAAITAASSVTAALWSVEIWLTTQTGGSSGTVMANGMATVYSGTAATVGSATGAPGTSAMTAGGVITPATASFNMTNSQDLTLTLTWGTANASNTATCLQFYVESLN
jgi:hypothetical protein